MSRARAHRRPRAGTWTAPSLLAAVILCAYAPAGWAAPGASRTTRAHSAASLAVKEEGTLHFVKSSGSTLTDEGHASGTIPGTVRIRFVYDGNPNVSAQITIYGSHGTISVRGSGLLSSPTNPNPSFSGTLEITSGTGRYRHAHGSGKLYGVFHRRTYAIVVQTRGTLHY